MGVFLFGTKFTNFRTHPNSKFRIILLAKYIEINLFYPIIYLVRHIFNAIKYLYKNYFYSYYKYKSDANNDGTK
jgi:hypothetical protein